jgi:hypothetical protein
MYPDHSIIYSILSLILFWTIAYFVVAKKNKQVKLFEKNLGFAIVVSMLLYFIAFGIIVGGLYETEVPFFLVIIAFSPLYVPPLWSFILIIYSIQLKHSTRSDEILDD